MDVDLLRRHTCYSGVSVSAPHIQYFWDVVAGFSQEQLRKLVKFAYAQERLPATDEVRGSAWRAAARAHATRLRCCCRRASVRAMSA